jgi:tight adherence protein C
VDRVLAAKFLLSAFGALLGLLLVSSGNALATIYGLVLPVAGFWGPDLMLGAQGKRRQREIRVALPDTLDQVTVCVEAGLGFEAALARAARSGSGPLADEIVRTMQDIQLGVPRKDALRRLGDRNGVEELRRFVLAVVQAEGYGVPIARVLRLQSAELREKRRQRAEEHAQKIGIKLLFPLVTCILPTVFIVILGPAIIGLMDTLGGRA